MNFLTEIRRHAIETRESHKMRDGRQAEQKKVLPFKLCHCTSLHHSATLKRSRPACVCVASSRHACLPSCPPNCAHITFQPRLAGWLGLALTCAERSPTSSTRCILTFLPPSLPSACWDTCLLESHPPEVKYPQATRRRTGW